MIVNKQTKNGQMILHIYEIKEAMEMEMEIGSESW